MKDAMISFTVSAKDKSARVGKIITPHGPIETPAFVHVGTQATVRAVSSRELNKLGSRVIITNAYHLHLQPGEDLVAEMGGLHSFMGWEGPLMTDSGGFQIFSLGAAREHGVGKVASVFPGERDRGGHFASKKKKPLVRIDEEGVEFTSYLDGAIHCFTPEGVVDMGRKFGSDIILPLDECTSPLHDYPYTRAAMERTHRWALRALEKLHSTPGNGQGLLGIIQGGAYRDLREESAGFIANQSFDGFAIGGSLGKSKEDMCHVLDWTTPFLPEDKPRHLLGIGEIYDIFQVVKRGIDLMDCVLPTRLARTGTLFAKDTEGFRMHILNARFRDDPRPIEEGCGCPTCCNHSRAYLRHLFTAKEPLAEHLAAIHNLHFIESLMKQIRSAIKEGELEGLAAEWNIHKG